MVRCLLYCIGLDGVVWYCMYCMVLHCVLYGIVFCVVFILCIVLCCIVCIVLYGIGIVTDIVWYWYSFEPLSLEWTKPPCYFSSHTTVPQKCNDKIRHRLVHSDLFYSPPLTLSKDKLDSM